MEPTAITAAASAAAAANKAADTGIAKALLMPVAKAYGDHWGKQARERLDNAAKAKRQANLRSHLESVEPTLDEKAQIDPEFFEKWLESAQKIDSLDEELSAAWRGVLRAAAEGSPYRQRLLQVVEQLAPDEALAFAALNRRTEYQYVKRFRDLGLLKSPLEEFRSMAFGMISAGLITSVAAGAAFYIAGTEFLTSPPDQGIRAGVRVLIPSIVLMWLIAVAWLLLRIALRPTRTRLGSALAAYTRSFKVAPTPPTD